MPKLKILSQKPIFRNNFFTVNESEIILPNGKKEIWNDVLVQPVVFVLPLTDENEIYLISQHRHLLGEQHIEIVAGYTNDSEDPLAAAKRELKEETGLIASKWKKLGIYNLASSVLKNDLHYYVAQGLTPGTQDLDEAEEIEIMKMPLEQAVDKVISGEINNQKTMTGLLLLNELKRQGKI